MPWSSAVADPADGGPGDPEDDAHPVRRGLVRPLDREPVCLAVLRRGVFPSRAAVRPFVDDAVAPADGRGDPERPAAGEPGHDGPQQGGQAGRRHAGDRHTTVQPKAITFPTDAKLMHRAREPLVRLAKTRDLDLRRSYERVGTFALIQQQRSVHARPFNPGQQGPSQAQDLSRPGHDARHRPQPPGRRQPRCHQRRAARPSATTSDASLPHGGFGRPPSRSRSPPQTSSFSPNRSHNQSSSRTTNSSERYDIARAVRVSKTQVVPRPRPARPANPEPRPTRPRGPLACPPR